MNVRFKSRQVSFVYSSFTYYFIYKISVYIYKDTHINVYICLYACIYVCIYVCMYVYMCVFVCEMINAFSTPAILLCSPQPQLD